MIEETLQKFPEQFAYEPVIENVSQWKKFDRFVVAGMGGSHLASGLLNMQNPSRDIVIHRDYGLPALPEENVSSRLFIASSYSGDTEETIDFFMAALERKLSLAALSTNGKLVELAQTHQLPFVRMPDTGIQPRLALGFSLKGQMKLMGDETGLREVSALASTLDRSAVETYGAAIAKQLQDKIPVIYASTRNKPIAYNWKIQCNETAKIPAFINTFPELDHNELSGFDGNNTTRALSEHFVFIFLRDTYDHPKIHRRMDSTAQLLQERGCTVHTVPVDGASLWERIFNALLVADWTALHLANYYGTDPEHAPAIEALKRFMK